MPHHANECGVVRLDGEAAERAPDDVARDQAIQVCLFALVSLARGDHEDERVRGADIEDIQLRREVGQRAAARRRDQCTVGRGVSD